MGEQNVAVDVQGRIADRRDQRGRLDPRRRQRGAAPRSVSPFHLVLRRQYGEAYVDLYGFISYFLEYDPSLLIHQFIHF